MTEVLFSAPCWCLDHFSSEVSHDDDRLFLDELLLDELPDVDQRQQRPGSAFDNHMAVEKNRKLKLTSKGYIVCDEIWSSLRV